LGAFVDRQKGHLSQVSFYIRDWSGLIRTSSLTILPISNFPYTVARSSNQ